MNVHDYSYDMINHDYKNQETVNFLWKNHHEWLSHMNNHECSVNIHDYSYDMNNHDYNNQETVKFFMKKIIMTYE